ncbi:MAG: glutathione S-transferase family protein [Deltaproteobacteria bacterium]|nr:glutathione S-transferase family protein [Deltaproteobacteria bacterium]
MKLYYSSGSCSTSCHITLEESGLKYEAIEVDFDNASDPNLSVVEKRNPILGTLPIFVTDEGKQLDQNIAIQLYVADKAPDKKLLPPHGTVERAEALNWMSFVAADLHKGIGQLFGAPYISKDAAVVGAVRTYMLENANKHIKYVDDKLADGREYLTGKSFTPADAYAFVVLGWTKYLEIPLTPYKHVQTYLGRVAARPAVASVLKAEGLV